MSDVIARVHLPLAGVLTAYLAFSAGGFFPGSVGAAAVVMALALLLRLTLAARPVQGWSPAAGVIGLALALLASWILLSGLWSGAPFRAVAEFDRALLYLLAFGFYATFPRRPGDLSIVLRWVLLAMTAAAAAGLATRLFPDALGHIPPRDPARLAYPLTYWNAMGVFCALGVVLAVHAAAGSEEPALVRVLAAASLPVLVVAGFFTFSRGGIATAVIGLVLYAVVAHPRRLAFALAAAIPGVAVALHAAYGADVLATERYFLGSGPGEGRDLALVVLLAGAGAALLRALLLVPERRVVGIELSRRWRRGLLGAGAAIAVVGVGVAAVALDGRGFVERQYDGFVTGAVVQESADYRQRLGASGSNGRLDFWGVDLDVFADNRLKGVGAGVFRLEWERRRENPSQAVDGHSLYLETLAELGVVGFALLLVALAGLLAVAVRGTRGGHRHAHAALLAAGVALLVHAGLDWDWEMPALFLWLFAAGGVAAARAAAQRPDERAGPGRVPRVLAGLLCLLIAVTPALVALSESSQNRAKRALRQGDCPTAIDASLDSLALLPMRAEPFELLGYCDLRAGAERLAVLAMDAARARDPDAWQYAYGSAVARALAGDDPRPAIADARRLNPKEPLVLRLARAMDTDSQVRRRRAAARAKIPDQ